MKNIHLEIPDNLHLKARQIQIELELGGEKVNLRDVFTRLLEKGIEKMEEEKNKKAK
jgi:hypothetical protein